MSAYIHGSGSKIQSSEDGLHKLYLMNPGNYVSYTDNTAATPSNMIFVHPSVHGNTRKQYNLTYAPPPPPHQPLLGVALPANMVGSFHTDDPGRSSFFTRNEVPGIQDQSAPRVQYHLWGPVIDETVSPMSVTRTATVHSGGAAAGTMHDASQMGVRRIPNQQGLSLSLSSQQTTCRSLSGETDVSGPGRLFPDLSPTNGGGRSLDNIRAPDNSSSSVSNGMTDIQTLSLGSKYLKAAQELLDEVVNVRETSIKKTETEADAKEKMKVDDEESSETGMDAVSSGASENNIHNQGVEFTTAQRQELQMKKTELVSMLDEVEPRYRQYRHQIQMVVLSFDEHAGVSGAAKPYTSLGLKTISKQFRCLKDAISSQIKATNKSLGEDHCLGVKMDSSRLGFVDHHLRQQRSMQQLGIIHPSAWRPQRGLPERAVSVLRAWLFEHFLHPYPKDSDKVLLAKQTGLTRSQVSNWFINARVRLWKPMVEEMYTEETKDQEIRNSSDNSHRLKQVSKELPSIATAAQESEPEMLPRQNVSTGERSISSMSAAPSGVCLPSQSGFHLLGSSHSIHRSLACSILSPDMKMKPGAEFVMNRQSNGGYSIENRTADDQGGGLFGSFSMGDMNGRFNSRELTPRFHGNGVSLTLGLPHSEKLSLSGNQHGIGIGSLPLQNLQLGRVDMGATGTEFCAITTSQASCSSHGFDNIDIHRNGFSAHLFPEFVSR